MMRPFIRLRRRVGSSIPRSPILSPSSNSQRSSPARQGRGPDHQRAVVGRLHEAGIAGGERDPRAAAAVQHANDDERQQPEELAMLIGHEGTHHAVGEAVDGFPRTVLLPEWQARPRGRSYRDRRAVGTLASRLFGVRTGGEKGTAGPANSFRPPVPARAT